MLTTDTEVLKVFEKQSASGDSTNSQRIHKTPISNVEVSLNYDIKNVVDCCSVDIQVHFLIKTVAFCLLR